MIMKEMAKPLETIEPSKEVSVVGGYILSFLAAQGMRDLLNLISLKASE